jgi:hypothetical protein
VSAVSRTFSYNFIDGAYVGCAGKSHWSFDAARPLEVRVGFGSDRWWLLGRDVLARRIDGLGDAACWTHGLWYYLRLTGVEERDEETVVMRFLDANVSAFLATARRLVPYGQERIDMDAGLALLLGGTR